MSKRHFKALTHRLIARLPTVTHGPIFVGPVVSSLSCWICVVHALFFMCLALFAGYFQWSAAVFCVMTSLTLTLLLITGCLLGSRGQLVAYTNGVADTPALDFYVDGELIGTLNYGNISEFKSISSGKRSFTTTMPGTRTVVARGAFDIATSNYTLVAVGTTSSPSFVLIFEPAPLSPGQYNTFMSASNIASDAGPVDIFVGSTKPTFSALTYPNIAGTFAGLLSGKNVDVTVKKAGSDYVLCTGKTDLVDGGTQFVYVMGLNGNYSLAVQTVYT